MSLPPTSQRTLSQGWARATLFFAVYITLSIVCGIIGMMTWSRRLILASIAAILCAGLFWKGLDKKPFMALGFTWKGYQQQAGRGFLLAVVLLGVAAVFLFARQFISWQYAAPPAADLVVAIGLLLLVSLQEEIVFRGYILQNLMESMDKRMALVISALLFALAHHGNPGAHFLGFLNLILAGCLLGYNFLYTRNIWFAFFFHASWNIVQGPLLGFDVSGLKLQSLFLAAWKTSSPLVTGGAFGLEGSLVATVLLASGVLLCWRQEWWRR